MSVCLSVRPAQSCLKSTESSIFLSQVWSGLSKLSHLTSYVGQMEPKILGLVHFEDTDLGEHLLAALDTDPHAGAQGGLEAVCGAGHCPRLEVMVAIPRPGLLG